MTARNIFALFVGIDAYPTPIRPLQGCVNDVLRVRTLLETRVAAARDRFLPLTLANEQATRQALIEAWRGHLGRATAGDVVLFYYSGHGSQEDAPPEFRDLEPDRRNETLVCYDSRLPGGWDLADKELAQLIAEVAHKQPHLAVVLDCCHAGSGTREDDEVTPRYEPPAQRTRPIESYIVTPQQAAPHLGGAAKSHAARPWTSIAWGRHVLLAACRPEQTAKETYLPGPQGLEKRGAFSYYLQETLQLAGGTLSYRDLFKRVNALVQACVPYQSPQLEAAEPADLDLPFLGGVLPAGRGTFTVSVDKTLDWVVDAGAVHGIPPPQDGEAAQLALFPFDTDLEKLQDLKASIGEATVTAVLPGQSRVAVTGHDGSPLDRTTTYKALLTGLPLPRLVVAFEGQAAALDRVREALSTLSPDGGPSLLVREEEEQAGKAEYRVLAYDDRLRIVHAGESRAQAVDTPGSRAEAGLVVAQRLEHIARWLSALRLRNPGSLLPPEAVEMALFREREGGDLEALDTAGGIRLVYEQIEGKWRVPRFQIRLRNTTPDRRLFCMLLDLTENFGINSGLLTGGGVWLWPGEEAWAMTLRRGRLTKTIDGYIPDERLRQGVSELRDILKLIVSTEEVDASLMQQGELPLRPVRDDHRAEPPRRLNTLNRLLARVQTRDFGVQPESDEAFADWTTTEIACTVVRPPEAISSA